MRLFIAICFNEESRLKVLQIQNILQSIAMKGRFIREAHLHLTVAFLGEVDTKKVDCVKDVMDSISIQPFTITFHNMGFFKRTGGDIWWIGAKENESIQALYKQLYMFLVKKNFLLPERPFIPHLTIAREVVLKEEVSIPICPFSCPVSAFYLMKSERIGGRLIYTKLYEKQL